MKIKRKYCKFKKDCIMYKAAHCIDGSFVSTWKDRGICKGHKFPRCYINCIEQ